MRTRKMSKASSQKGEERLDKFRKIRDQVIRGKEVRIPKKSKETGDLWGELIECPYCGYHRWSVPLFCSWCGQSLAGQTMDEIS